MGKVSELTADTAPTSDDLIMTVNAPGSTPASRKVTLANLFTHMPANCAITDGTYTHKIECSQDEGLSGADLRIGLDETLRSLILCDAGDISTDFGMSADSHPTLHIKTAAGTTDTSLNYAQLKCGTYFSITLNSDRTSGDVVTFDSTSKNITDADAEQAWIKIEPNVTQTSTAAYVGILLDSTETTVGDASAGEGYNALMDLRVGGVSAFRVENAGEYGNAGTTGAWLTKVSEATVNITAVATCTIQVDIPSGAKLLGAQLRVDSALADGETWNAQYVTGATATIASAAAVAKNTKANATFDENAATAITSDETDITIQRSSDPGNDTFTAQGTIRAIVYYQEFTAMADAA